MRAVRGGVGTLVLPGLLLSACSVGGPSGTPPAESPRASRPPFLPSPSDADATASPTVSPAVTPTVSPRPIELSAVRWTAVRADLAERGVRAEPVLVSAEAVTWRDGSWGCPQPGSFYTQALVPGARVVVEAGGVRYDYRFGRGDVPRLCERGWAAPPAAAASGLPRNSPPTGSGAG